MTDRLAARERLNEMSHFQLVATSWARCPSDGYGNHSHREPVGQVGDGFTVWRCAACSHVEIDPTVATA